MNSDNRFYVYEWYNIDTGEVFYVGKGCSSRYKTVTGRNRYFTNYHKKYNCDVRKIKECMIEKDAFELEIEKIKYYRETGQCKCNLSDGGEGGFSDNDKNRKSLTQTYKIFIGISKFCNLSHYSKLAFARIIEEYDIVSVGCVQYLSNKDTSDILNRYEMLKEEEYDNDMLNDNMLYDDNGKLECGWDELFGEQY